MNLGLIQLFRRTTTTKNFIPEIDGFRFLAIGTVILFHFHFLLAKSVGDELVIPSESGSILEIGWWLVRMDLGVKVFFGISGFILSIPFLKQYLWGGKPIVLKSYLVRRLTRLEPPFIVAITGFLLVHWLVLGEPIGPLMPHFFATLVYLHTVIYNSYSTILPVTWSLETEVQFYLVIPLLASLILGRGPRWIALISGVALFLASIAFRGFLLRQGVYGMMASLPAFLSHFLVGIGFAYLYLSRLQWLKAKGLGWDFLGVIGFVGMFWFYKPQADFMGQIAFNASIFLFFIAGFKGNVLNYLLTRPWVYLTGGMCYTLYLLHLPLFGLLVGFSDRLIVGHSYFFTFLVQFGLAMLVLLGIGGLFFLFVEKPCMEKDWHIRLSKKIGAILSK